MPTDNFTNPFNHFSVEEMKEMSEFISKITKIAQPKLKSFTAEEREKYQLFDTSKKLFVNRVMEYKLAHSELSSKDIDWDEFNLIFADRAFLRSSVFWFKCILISMEDTLRIYDTENFKCSLEDYEHTKQKADEKNEKFEEKFNELKLLMDNIGLI